MSQVFTGEAPVDLGNFFRAALRDHAPTELATTRTHVDHPVGALDYVQIVFDDNHGIALVDKALEHKKQLTDVFKM